MLLNSLAFNTIIPTKLITKLKDVRLNFKLNWIMDFLIGRPQVVRIINQTSTVTLNLSGSCTRSSCSPCSCQTQLQFKYVDETTTLCPITNDPTEGRLELYHNDLTLNSRLHEVPEWGACIYTH